MTEIQAAHAEREAAKLQKELDAVIEELQDWKDKYQEICVELEQTFNEMAGYWSDWKGGRVGFWEYCRNLLNCSQDKIPSLKFNFFSTSG